MKSLFEASNLVELELLGGQFYTRSEGSARRVHHVHKTDSLRPAVHAVVKAWRDIPVGSPVYALDDAVRAKDRLQEALVQRIDFQVEYGTSGVNRGMVMCPCE